MSGIVLENKWGKDPTHLTIGVSSLTWAGQTMTKHTDRATRWLERVVSIMMEIHRCCDRHNWSRGIFWGSQGRVL